MSIEEQCKKFGVPMPETCKRLAFEKPTLHYWIDCPDEGGLVVVNHNQIDNLHKYGIKFEEVASAPQLHEFGDCDCGYMLWLYGDFDVEIVAYHKIKQAIEEQ